MVLPALTPKIYTALVSSGIVVANVLIALCGFIGDTVKLDYLESSLAFTILMMFSVVGFMGVLAMYRQSLVGDAVPSQGKDENKSVNMNDLEYAPGSPDIRRDDSVPSERAPAHA
jgi:hypothetical protein